MLSIDSSLLNCKGKIMHQIWFGTIPNKREAKKAYESLAYCRNSWIIKNPDWKRVEWNKETCTWFVKTFYPEHYDMFKNYPYEIQRCDMVRYLILHRYGGWYIDMDYFCNRSLNEVHETFKGSLYLVETPNYIVQDYDCISNSLMYSIPGHPFWKELMITLEKNSKSPYYYTKHLAVMTTTGPVILNRTYQKSKYKYSNGLKIRSLPYQLFHPYGIQDEKLSLIKNKKIYAIHIGKGSWENGDSKFLIFFVREWKLMMFLVCLLILSYILTKISKR
jgi:inositol phosphorylceramide mannosyltransferase catalytic subunit